MRRNNEPLTPLGFGGALSAFGALGLLIANVFYALSPIAASAPNEPFDAAAAMAAAAHGDSTLKLAGAVGIFGDLVWATAALLLAQEQGRRGRSLSSAGWNALVFAILLFFFVDGMTGFVFPQLAASDNLSAFEGLRRLWDVLFRLCAFAFGVASLAIVAADLRDDDPVLHRLHAFAMLAVGSIGCVAALAGFGHVRVGGLPVNGIAGASIGVGAAFFIPLSLRLWLRARSQA